MKGLVPTLLIIDGERNRYLVCATKLKAWAREFKPDKTMGIIPFEWMKKRQPVWSPGTSCLSEYQSLEQKGVRPEGALCEWGC